MERAFKCDVCSEKFISQSKLNHHSLREHGKPAVRPKKRFDCNVCGKKCTQNDGLIKHMRTHTGERPFKCTEPDCGKAFVQSTHMKTHMRSHTGERPFKCAEIDCGKAFARNGDLKMHMRRHTGERPFKCTVTDCQMDFKRQSHLKEHIKYKHSDERPLKFNLSDCRFKAKTSHILMQHKKEHDVDLPFTTQSEGCKYPSTRGDNSKCSHLERADSPICSSDDERMLGNQNQESSIQCNDQSGFEKTFANADDLYNANLCAHSEPSLVCHSLNCSYATISAEDLLALKFVHIERNETDFCATEAV